MAPPSRRRTALRDPHAAPAGAGAWTALQTAAVAAIVEEEVEAPQPSHRQCYC